MTRRLVLSLSCLLLTGFFLLSSFYCLLASIPFTFHQVIESPLLAWQPFFVRAHPLICLLVIALAFFSRRRTTPLSIYAAAHFAFGIFLFFHPVLSALRLSHQSFYWALFFLEPMASLGVIELIEGRNALVGEKETPEDSRIFEGVFFTTIFLTVLYALIPIIRAGGRPGAGPADYLWLTMWSLSAHLVVAMGVFLALTCVRAAANFLFVSNFDAEFVLLLAFATVIGSSVVRSLILGPLNFRGPVAQLFALMVSLSVTLLYGGVALLIGSQESQEPESGTDLALRPLLGYGSRRAMATVLLTAAVCVALFVAVRVSVLDWNFLFQKLGALVVWVVAFVAFYAISRRLKRDYTFIFMIVAGLALVIFKLVQLGTDVDQTGRVTRQQLDRYAAFNPSLLLARDFLTPPVPVDETPLYRLLQASSNIPRAIPTPPVELDFVPSIAPAVSPPNIFIIVIDSLRRDYLSPHNARVTFTPSIARFAAENIVFRNAFTRYGGTGLSEPSIWVGGMILHKQYVTPFHPMNRLEKLLEVNHYRSYLGMDAILQEITRPSSSTFGVDTDGPSADLCVSLRDLDRKLAADAGRPLFSYLQPQNIHISAINREGNTTGGRHYPGFHDPYAWRLERLDRCVGTFIDALKEKKLYDDSVVIITSDHGDSLGEDGRWGHAYTIFPEILKIPLLVHLPSSMRGKVEWNAEELAFLTDLAPSLYYLLGYRGLAPSEFSGRSLFRAPGEPPFVPGESYLVASSYGAVFGVMSGDAKSLYISDALNFRDYSYDLGTGEPLVLSAAEEKRRRLAIEQKVEALNRIFRFTPPAGNNAAVVMR